MKEEIHIQESLEKYPPHHSLEIHTFLYWIDIIIKDEDLSMYWVETCYKDIVSIIEQFSS